MENFYVYMDPNMQKVSESEFESENLEKIDLFPFTHVESMNFLFS